MGSRHVLLVRRLLGPPSFPRAPRPPFRRRILLVHWIVVVHGAVGVRALLPRPRKSCGVDNGGVQTRRVRLGVHAPHRTPAAVHVVRVSMRLVRLWSVLPRHVGRGMSESTPFVQHTSTFFFGGYPKCHQLTTKVCGSKTCQLRSQLKKKLKKCLSFFPNVF